MKPISIYLAGPDVFFSCDLETGAKKIKFCEELDAVGIYPSFLLPENLFTDVYTKTEKREIINKQCKSGILEADIIIGNLTPFRGHEMDSGTAFEIGFADALGKLIYGYTNNPDTYLERMQKQEGTYQDSLGVWRDKDNNIIENFGLVENCMIGSSCKKLFIPSPHDLEVLKKDPLHMFKKTVEYAVIDFKFELEKELLTQDNSSKFQNKKHSIR